MKSALRPALPLLMAIALAGVLALVAMHSLSFGAPAVAFGSHHSVGSAAVSAHGHPGAEAPISVLSEHEGTDADHAGHGGAGHGGAAATSDGAAQDPALNGAAVTSDGAAHDHVTGTGTGLSEGHGASGACASPTDAECCTSVVKGSGAPSVAVHPHPGATVSAIAASGPVVSLLATEAPGRPPSRALLSVIRV